MNEPENAQATTITIVVAMARNGIIGRDGDMPWHLSTDLKRFKAITLGKPVVMGRKTFQSIGRPLPGRKNIVVTRDAAFSANGIETFATLDDAVTFARTCAIADGLREICILGGGEIYRQMLPLADCLHVTHVDCEPDGDTVFPEIDERIWEKESEELVPAGEKDTAASRYAVYRRKVR
ncbi:dihydrofolate reductase [Hoeflea sp. TYP-13]|uniref:dihydrofolate reductase n=1 Tax=Hoeflea sp. TYP-13 TaxID=3230023 RepID=UPI0034C63740